MLTYTMNKSAKNSVAFFLAAALITGVFAISAPSIIDIEATEDKRSDYKQNDRYEEKDYGYEEEKKYSHDDREKKYGYGEEKKYGDEMKYGYAEEEKKYSHDDREKDYGYGEEKKYGNEMKYGYEEDNKYGDKDKDKSIKYVSCQNININGKSFQKDGMNRGHSSYGEGHSTYGGESSYPDLMAYGEESSYGENSYPNHNSKPDYVKETHKDVTIICIQKNQKEVPEEDPTCLGCFDTRPDGFLPKGQLMKLERALEALPDRLGISTIEDLCDAIEDGTFPEQRIERLINAVFGSGQSGNLPPFAEKLLDCLVGFLPTTII